MTLYVKNRRGFTIVELLVVIVVIGILATITIVTYIGISSKATLANLQSDLVGASQQLKLYRVDHGVFPASLDVNNCPVAPTDARYCLRPSPNNLFSYTSSSPFQSFSLTATNTPTNIAYVITDDSGPVAVGAGFYATGGAITYTDSSGLNPRSMYPYPGGYTVHTFTSSGTFIPSQSGNVEILAVGGGGGGGTW